MLKLGLVCVNASRLQRQTPGRHEAGGDSSLHTEGHFPAHMFLVLVIPVQSCFYMQMVKSMKPDKKQIQLGEMDAISLCKTDFSLLPRLERLLLFVTRARKVIQAVYYKMSEGGNFKPIVRLFHLPGEEILCLYCLLSNEDEIKSLIFLSTVSVLGEPFYCRETNLKFD